ncbi:DNA/RNA non-specific endonuclease [Halomonas sp. McH1-25]|uniref:DNA/RNA non-specific endonuclease n=1 Tax=unclassified Halomonas TaxID=2609666 RepID=UPI001EF5EBCA|nr:MULTISPECIES: DNA/RNA non-specific endonuclease [unclassified Halomonas]MCG7600687.1 DNA/RNA non-specific endonuclease [Halomonas sp. McH1-25]MCP1341265.1 DNA/RNA non-specific endonuclease [Halomonas sp. FL8]MCP1363039.1 DNA/RNA non-specific endonuclease [Halomonas sp. BBD45]MCP1367219.1 DNA/RNA non-specific endonuclease [Halomonas sp. BBD48]
MISSLPFVRRQVRNLGVSLLFVMVASGLWYWQEQDVRDRLSWMGVTTWDEPGLTNFHRVLRNEGVLIGWSDVRVNPLWVSYRLHRVDDARIGSRPDFRRDWRTLWPVMPDSYFGSGYDRGHLAPNYAIARVHGAEAQRDTFLMSNVSPQRPDLNRRLWQRLEEVVIDHFVPRFGAVQVITGPVFSTDFLANVFNRVGLVEVPQAFYKIVVVPGERPKALAFLMPQTVQGNEPLDRFLVSIDEIEARTGLDFFPLLPDNVENVLEGSIRSEGWALDKVARLPSRY